MFRSITGSRGPSPGNDGRECRCRSGVKEKPGQSCLVAGHPDKKRHPTTFYSLAPLLRGFLFTISASISATHRWMPVWNQKTVSAQCSPHLRISGSCPGFFGVVMLSGSTAHTCAPCGLPAVSEPPALVSLVRACGGASFAPTPRLLRASLPLRRYVRRRRRWYLAPWGRVPGLPAVRE